MSSRLWPERRSGENDSDESARPDGPGGRGGNCNGDDAGAGPRRDNLKLKVHDDPTSFEQYRDRTKRTPGERSLGKPVGVHSDVLT